MNEREAMMQLQNSQAQKTAAFFLLSFLLALLSACGKQEENAKSKSDAAPSGVVTLKKSQLALSHIKLGSFMEKPVSRVIEANGKMVILPQFQATIAARVNGSVEKILVQEGAFVKKDEPMFIISSFELIQIEQDYQNAKSQLTYAGLDLERQKKMQEEQIGATKDFQGATARYQQLQTAMNVAKAKLELLRINPDKAGISGGLTVSAPISGYIVELAASVGFQTQAGTVLAKVYNTDHPYAEAYVYPKDINLVAEGAKVEVDFLGQNLAPVTGVIEKINRTVDPGVKSIILHCRLDQIKGVWIPEMALRAKISTPGRTQPTLPVSSLLLEEDNSFIYYTTDGDKEILNFTKVPVGISFRDKDIVVVSLEKPLPPNAQIVTDGVMFVNGETTKNEE